MRRITRKALAHSRCLWRADKIVDGLARFLRNGGYQELKRGDNSSVNNALSQLRTLRQTHLTRAEYEDYRHNVWRMVANAAATEKSPRMRPCSNVCTIREYDARRRAWGLGHVNRPRTLPY